MMPGDRLSLDQNLVVLACSLPLHAAADFIASLSFFGSADKIDLLQAVAVFNTRSPSIMRSSSVLLWTLPFPKRSCQE